MLKNPRRGHWCVCPSSWTVRLFDAVVSWITSSLLWTSPLHDAESWAAKEHRSCPGRKSFRCWAIPCLFREVTDLSAASFCLWRPEWWHTGIVNPLGAWQSFQLWYPGGQRLKVISFSWSWVKSLSKCFSNAEPTTIIASRDEKRCNASVQWARLVHSRSLRLGDQHRKRHEWLFFFAGPRSAAWPTCYFTATCRKTANRKTVEISGLGNRLLKTRWFPRWFL